MKVTQEVLKVLDSAATDGNRLILPGQLDRPLYAAVDKVIKAVGGKWNRYQRAHLFDQDAPEAIEPILLTGEVTTAQEFGYFPTPAPVVDQLLSLADLSSGHEVLEPSAGQGAIAEPIAQLCAVDCVELLEKNAKHITDAGYARSVTVGDFLKTPATPTYDRVVMNPPFAKQADLTHVLHAHRFLRPSGRLVAVMSNGVTFRNNRATAAFRALVNAAGGSIEPLPDDAFKSSGTGVRTVITVLPALPN